MAIQKVGLAVRAGEGHEGGHLDTKTEIRENRMGGRRTLIT
jgi:hypothetical protein